MPSNRTRSLRLLVLAAAATPIPPAPAAAAPCLTHEQARQKYLDSHLWWHTDNHCWDDSRRGRGDYESQATSSDISDKSGKVATPADQAVPGVHTTVYYPTLEVNGAWSNFDRALVEHANMSTWPLLLDIDQSTKFGAWRDRITGAWGGRR